MTEFIPDLREVERVPGLDIAARLSDHPLPGFQDAMGNFVGEGDWVATGASTKYGNQLRLAKVLEIRPLVRSVHDYWREKPEEEWTDWDREYLRRYNRDPNYKPRESVPKEITVPHILVRQYFDLRPDSWSRRTYKSADEVVRYTGPVSYIR